MSAITRHCPQTATFGRIMLCVDSAENWANAATLFAEIAGADTQVRIVGLLENARAAIPHAPLAIFNLSAAHAQLRRTVGTNATSVQACLKASGITADTQIADLFEDGGDAAHALTRAAHAWHADLLVLGARHHLSVLRWTERAPRDAPSLAHCSLLVLPEQPPRNPITRPRRLLCAVDGSPASLDALRAGARLAATGAYVKAVYVLDLAAGLTDGVARDQLREAFVEEGRDALAKAQKAFAQSWGAQGSTFDAALIRTEEEGDDIAHTLVREATRWNADAIVMGTHGQRGVARWMLGTVSGRVTELTNVPLLLSRRQAHGRDADTGS